MEAKWTWPRIYVEEVGAGEAGGDGSCNNGGSLAAAELEANAANEGRKRDMLKVVMEEARVG